jgi:2-polyprenyl-3-methyl-5-hydroxy-6-metoxy-1,4-benzoquinol methylase
MRSSDSLGDGVSASQLSENKLRAIVTYNAASDHFDDDPLSFWDRAGRGTVDRLALPPGSSVLDVACGSGASALPAAERVGPSGTVIGVDLAERLLELGRAKARARGLSPQVNFLAGDMERLEYPEHSFDTVICVFGIFFASDMPSLVGALWKLVRHGGQLAVTTWGPRMFEPGSSLFWAAIQQERPDLYRSFQPWDRINDVAALQQMLGEGGIAAEQLRLVPEAGTQPLYSPEDFWTVALGSGYRGTIDQLDPDARERVRSSVLSGLREQQVGAIETNVIYAVASKR